MKYKIRHCEICNTKINCDKHHIIPQSQRGSNQKSNVVYLCANCHRRVHTEEITISGYRMTTTGRILIFQKLEMQ